MMIRSEFSEMLQAEGWWDEAAPRVALFSDLIMRTWIEIADTYDPKQLDRIIGPVVFWINNYCPDTIPNLRASLIPTVSRLYVMQQMLSGPSPEFSSVVLSKYADRIPSSTWHDVQRVVEHLKLILRAFEESGALDHGSPPPSR